MNGERLLDRQCRCAQSRRLQAIRRGGAGHFRKFGGHFVTRGGKSEVVEGKVRSRIVVLEFPSYEAALACYRSPEYAKAITLRQASADADLIVIEATTAAA